MSRNAYHQFGSNYHRSSGAQFFHRFKSTLSHAGQVILNCICLKPIKLAGKWLESSSGSPTNIILCGLRGSGKTTILYRLKLGIFIHTIPSASTIYEKFDFGLGFPTSTLSLSVYDLRPDEFLSPCNRLILKNTQRIIYILDSTNMKQLKDASNQIQSIMYHNNFVENGGKLLIFCNKQDSPKSLNTTEISEILELPPNLNSSLIIMPCSALSGIGIEDGIYWLFESSFLNHQSPTSVYSPLLNSQHS